MIVAIDALNIRLGGGLTHLVELLANADPSDAGIDRVVAWTSSAAAGTLPRRPWLDVRTVTPTLPSFVGQIEWTMFGFPRAVRAIGADVVLLPAALGGRRLWAPSVVIVQNLLPFDEAARSLYTGGVRFRLELLRRAQSRTLQRAAGVIHLTSAAAAAVSRQVPIRDVPSEIIPHGADEVLLARRTVRRETPGPDGFTWLYASIIDRYKHQDVAARAVGLVAAHAPSVSLRLVGPTHEPALNKLRPVLRDPAVASHCILTGPMGKDALRTEYELADAFLFLSTCETFGLVLLDALAAGLPVVAADTAVSREIAGAAAVYCDPLDPQSVAANMEMLMKDHALRGRLASAAKDRARRFRWTDAAAATWRFVAARAGGAHSR